MIRQRLQYADPVGQLLAQAPREVLSFPAIAEADEMHQIETIWGPRCFRRRQGEALHLGREPLKILDRIRRTIGEYNFAGQYQQFLIDAQRIEHADVFAREHYEM